MNFRDPLVSLIQSAAGTDPLLSRAAEALGLSKQGADPGVADAEALRCVTLAHDLLTAAAADNYEEVARLKSELAFSTCDPRWVETITEYVTHTSDPIPYIRAAVLGNTVLSMKNAATVAIVGDWGTGTDIAIAVLNEIAAHKPDVLIHLGDVYYSGTEDEVAANFWKPIKTALPDATVLTLCGNHDVYSGGQGYYGLIRSLGQPASFFCLRSPDQRWQFCAMDTGLHDRDPLEMATNLTYIEPDEEDYLTARIAEFPGQTILLSHHQPFSALEQIGPAQADGSFKAVNPKLAASFMRFALAAPGRIAAWFWGHEHAFSVYDAYIGLNKGRCLGHGAVPVFVDAPPNPVVAKIAYPPELMDIPLGNDGDTYKHGYAIVRLDTGAARYYQTGVADPLFIEIIGDSRASPKS